MKPTAIFSALLALSAALTACTLGTAPAQNEVSGPVALRIHAGAATKASGADGVYWDKDTIGVLVDSVKTSEDVVDEDSNMSSDYRNVGYIAQKESNDLATETDFDPLATGPGQIWFDTESTVYVCAYAPYIASDDNSTLPGEGGTLTVNTDAAHQNYPRSLDLLYAPDITVTRDDPKATFTFSHVMAQIVLDIIPDDESGMTEAIDVSGFTLGGLVLSGTFDVTKGEVFADNDDRTDLEPLDLSDIKTATTPDGSTYGKSFTLLVCPQTAILSFTANGVTKDNANETYLHGGRSYRFTATVASSDVTLTGGELYPWEDYTGEE